MRDIFLGPITLKSAGGGCVPLIHWANRAALKYDLMEIFSEIRASGEGPAIGLVGRPGVTPACLGDSAIAFSVLKRSV